MDIEATLEDMATRFGVSAHLSRVNHPGPVVPIWCAETTSIDTEKEFTIRSDVSAVDAMVKLALCLQHVEASKGRAGARQ